MVSINEKTIFTETYLIMNILVRYICQTIVSTILVITLVLMGIEMLIVFIGELGSIGDGNYNVMQALRYVVLDMPYQLNILFPMAGLVGSLFGLGMLANQSELIVMRASGYSAYQIAFAVLLAALLMALLAMLLGEVIAPAAENSAINGRALAKSTAQAVSTHHGIWVREGNDFINIAAINSRHHMLGITSYHFENRQLQNVLFAKKADFIDRHWLLTDVQESIINSNYVANKTFATLNWSMQLPPGLLDVADIDPRNMSLIRLHTYIQYLKSNSLRSANNELSFWKRILQPLATVIMIFLAVPFVFGPLRTVTMGLRVVTGISVGFIFYILSQFFTPLTILLQIPPIIGASVPLLIFIGIGLWFMVRIR